MEEESFVIEVIKSLRSFLHNQLRVDNDLIFGLQAAALLNESDVSRLRSLVDKGGNEALYDLLQYMESYYDEDMLQKFCVFLDEKSKPAKPRLGKIAERIRQEMKK